MTEFRGPIHIGLDLASDILERCGEEKAKEIALSLELFTTGSLDIFGHESTVDLETLQDRFCDQLKLTVPGEWTDIGGGQRNYSSSNLVTLVDACTATNRGVMMLAFLNPFVEE